MINRISGLALMVIAFLTAMPAYSQTGDDGLRFAQRFPGVTPASAGIAGVGIAGTGDASAFATNPAGLGWAPSSSFSGSLSTLFVTDLGDFQAPGHASTLENELSKTGLGNASYLFKVGTSRGSLVLGGAFHQQQRFDRALLYDGTNNANSITDFFMPLANEFTLTDDGSGVSPEFSRTLSFIGYETYAIDLDQDLLDAGAIVPFVPAVRAGTISQTGVVEEKGRIAVLNVGGAAEVSHDVMVGVSLNIPFGTYSFYRTHDEVDIDNANNGSNGTTDFAGLEFTESFDANIVGVSLKGGLSAEVVPGVRLGLSAESPTVMSIEEDYQTQLRTRFDNGDVYEYGDGSTENAGTGSFDYEIRTPWRLGVGGSLSRGGLRLSADAEWVDWSQMEFDASDYSFIQENLDIQQGLTNVLNLRAGASFYVEGIEIRAGIAQYPDAHKSTASGTTSDKDRLFYSAGFGYEFSSQFKIDFSWMRNQFDDRFSPYTEVDGAPVVMEDVTRDRVMIGFEFSF